MPQKHQVNHHKNTKQNAAERLNNFINSFIFITFVPTINEFHQ